jgi:hypothetical protein
MRGSISYNKKEDQRKILAESCFVTVSFQGKARIVLFDDMHT